MKTGYTFKGWDKTVPAEMPDSDVTLKAVWTVNTHTLTWDLDGGTAEGTYTSGTVAYGAEITAPTPVKTGYTFKGWDKTVPATMPDSDVTLKAVWEKDAAARIPGDVNDDGKVNMQDLTRLQQYLAKWEVTINESNANVNGDNDINMKDLTRLQQKLANWDVELV